MIEYQWSRFPGKFIDKVTGEVQRGSFNGSVREWYEILIEVTIDVFLAIRSSGCEAEIDLVASDRAQTILQSSVLYGIQSSCGLLLKTTPAGCCKTCSRPLEVAENSLEFVNRETGEVVGRLRIVD